MPRFKICCKIPIFFSPHFFFCLFLSVITRDILENVCWDKQIFGIYSSFMEMPGYYFLQFFLILCKLCLGPSRVFVSFSLGLGQFMAVIYFGGKFRDARRGKWLCSCLAALPYETRLGAMTNWITERVTSSAPETLYPLSQSINPNTLQTSHLTNEKIYPLN